MPLLETRPKIRGSIPGISKGQCGLRIPIDHRLPMIPCQMALASRSIMLYRCPPRAEIGGQDEVVDMPNYKVRIQTIMEERSTMQCNMMDMDQSTVTRIKEPRMAKERQYMEKSPPPLAAAPAATAPTGIPASTVSSPPSMAQCLFSPSAPQVEDYALDAVPVPSNLEQGSASNLDDGQAGRIRTT